MTQGTDACACGHGPGNHLHLRSLCRVGNCRCLAYAPRLVLHNDTPGRAWTSTTIQQDEAARRLIAAADAEIGVNRSRAAFLEFLRRHGYQKGL